MSQNPYSSRYNSDDEDTPQRLPSPASFRRRHPVVMNLVYILLVAVALGYGCMWFLDYWTFHGEERAVPDVKGQLFATAQANVDANQLNAVIADSVFDSYTRPGTVVEQIPIPGAKIKKGGNVYLTIVAFSPKLVTVPEFYNVSVRQARSMFESLGIAGIREEEVPSEYEGLVLGARFNGAELRPGARIPMSAIVTLQVGAIPQPVPEDSLTYEELDQEIDRVLEGLNIE